MANLPKGGLRDIQHLRKSINNNEENDNASKYVKIKFTRRQYDTFIKACNIFSVIVKHDDFHDFVVKALETKDITQHVINTQLINPIETAPTKIYDPVSRKSMKNTTVDHKPKITYFNQPREITDSCISLYEKVKNVSTLHTQYNVLEGNTSITDIRTMLGKYINEYELKNEYGTIFDDFMQSIAPETFNQHKSTLLYIDDNFLIPKKDKKLIYYIIREIIFN